MPESICRNFHMVDVGHTNPFSLNWQQNGLVEMTRVSSGGEVERCSGGTPKSCARSETMRT